MCSGEENVPFPNFFLLAGMWMQWLELEQPSRAMSWKKEFQTIKIYKLLRTCETEWPCQFWNATSNIHLHGRHINF